MRSIFKSGEITMRRFLLFVCLLSPLAGLSAEETLRVEGLGVDRVLVYGPVEAEISQGDPVLLLIRGDERSLQQQPFFVQGTTLILGRNENGERGDQDFSQVKFKLTLPELHSLQLKGSGDVYVRPLEVSDFSVALEGSGDMKFFAVKGQNVKVAGTGSGDIELANLAVRSLTIVQAGSGDIVLGELEVESLSASLNGSGDIGIDERASVTELTMNIVGSGDIDFGKIDSKTAVVKIVGSGTASLGASSTLVANIMGSGEIYYRGNPDIEQTVLGSGGLHRQNQ
jgi:hypothetical protein